MTDSEQFESELEVFRGEVETAEPCVGGLQPFPPLHAAHAAHAGHRGVARGQALAGSRRRPAQRRHGAADAITGGRIEDGMLRIERTEAAVPDGAADLVADLYQPSSRCAALSVYFNTNLVSTLL